MALTSRLLAAAISLSLAGHAFAAAISLEEGMKLMRAERFPEAIGVLEQAARREPGSIDILKNLGWAYWRVKRVEDAWRCFSMLVKLDPDNPHYLKLLAEIEVARGNNQTALNVSKKALRIVPNDRDTSVVLARAYVNLKRFEDAERLLEAVIEQHPNHPGAQAAIAEYLSQTGRNLEALFYFDKLVASDPESISYRRSRARVLYQLGDFAAATGEWEKIAEQKPDEDTLMNLGWAYWQAREFEQAHRIAQTLLRLDTANPAFLRFMANIEMERRDFPEALKWAQRARALVPDDRDTLLACAKAMFNLGRDEEAVAIVERLMKVHPDHPGVQYHHADFSLGLGRPSHALPIAEFLIKSDAANPAYRKLKARALYDLGRFEDAAADWKQMAQQKPPDVEALEMLYNDAIAREEWTEAVSRLEELAAVEPKDALHYQRLAAAYWGAGRDVEALEAVEQALEIDPAQTAMHYMKGEIHERRLNWRAARRTYEKILHSNPSARRAVYALIRVSEAEGDSAGALELLRLIKASQAKRPSPYVAIDEARLLAQAGRPEAALTAVSKLIAQRTPAVPIIAYARLSRFGRSEFVALETFRKQMQSLKRAGFNAIGFEELDRFVKRVAPLPKKPVIITFDDPRVDLFKQVDPILAEAGFKAVVFAHIGGLKRYPAQPSIDALRYWFETGRWEIQSHGSAAHDMIRVDEGGRMGHFLTNRAWLEDESRQETAEEYRRRIDKEFREAKARLIEAFPRSKVSAFAFPFGDSGQEFSNAADAALLNDRLARKYFSYAVIPDADGFNIASTKPSQLLRFEVKRVATAPSLERHLTMNDPWVRAKMTQAALWARAGQPGRALAVYDQLEHSGVRQPELHAQRGGAMRQAGNDFEAQRLFVRAYAADPEYVRYQNLMEQAKLLDGPRLGSHVEGYNDSLSNASAKALARMGVSVGRLELSGWGGRGVYADRRMNEMGDALVERRIDSREAGVDARGFLSSGSQIYGSASRRQFDGLDPVAPNFSGGLSVYLLPELRANLDAGESNVETLEAIRRGRRVRNYAGGIEWDVAINWRATANLEYFLYNDDNFQNDLRLGLSRRITDRFSLGYSFRQGDSARLTSEYWTPRRLKQHMGTLVFVQPFGRNSQRTGLRPGEFQLEGGAGYGLQERASSLVQTGRAALSLRILDHLMFTIDGQYTRRPTYIRRQVSGGLSLSY